ncbi:MAG: response regulator transcription factor [Solirubrobacterales bacterium]
MARAASGAATSRERAHDVLAALERLIPYDSALFASWDPLSRHHRPVANSGYDERVVRHLCSEAFERELTYFGSRSSSSARRLRDLPCDPSAVPTWANVLGPEGFAEGLTVCLHDGGGRYLGLLNVSTTASTGAPTDSARHAIDLLAGTLANAIDNAHLNRHLIDLAEPEAAAVMIGADGGTVALPDCEGDECLVQTLVELRGGPLDAARRLLRLGRLPAQFVWRAPAESGWRRVHVIACEPSADEERSALVAVGRQIDAYGLTIREMEVLSFLVQGWSNRSISEHFVVAPRTVATHVERVLAKLDEHSRAGAAGRASREGLLFPFVHEDAVAALAPA